MPPKPVLMTFVERYLPGFKGGGPLRTISSMAELLADEFTFRVVTHDRDVGDQQPYPGMSPGRWNLVGCAEVMYLPPSGRSFLDLARLLRNTAHDVVYLNSFFSPDFTIRPLVLRRLGIRRRTPVVLAPRGEFSPEALALKGTKKRSYIAAAKASRLYDGLYWQASSEFEAEEIRRLVGPDPRIHVAGDLASGLRASAYPGTMKIAGELRLIFVSRVVPKKNLLGAIDCLAEVIGKVELVVVGPLEDAAYWAECVRRTRRLPSNVTFRYAGAVPHAEVGAAFRKHHVLLLPTLGENFGHVILEALLSGLPVITSDATPWRNLASLNAGMDLPLGSTEALRNAVQMFVDMDESRFATWRSGALRLGAARLHDQATIAANRALFHEVLAART